jgi:hypothetical protein
MLKFDHNEFLTLDRFGSLIARVTSAWQASPAWLKQHGIR